MRDRCLIVWLVLSALMLGSVSASAVELLIWDYVDWRVEHYQRVADEYMQLNPDVEIKVQLIGFGEFVDKIKVGIIAGAPPAMFAGHPTWFGDFAGLLEPFPHDLFPPDKLSDELLGYRQLLQDGYAYYYPLGMQGPVLWINEDHWDNAGIGDPPTTWEEAVDIGRRMTRVHDGITSVAGFYFADGDMTNDLFIDLNYQFGGKIYRAGGTEVTFDEPAAQAAINLIHDMFLTGVSGLGESLSFQAGQHGMRYGFAWRQQQIAPMTDLRWRVEPIPTLTGSLHEGMSRMDYYLGIAVPMGNDPEVVREAFKFLQWAYEDDELLMALNSASGTLPARYSLWNHPEVQENPVLRLLTQTLPYATTPGEYPQWIKNSLSPVRTAIINGVGDPVVLLQDITRQINARLRVEPVTWVAE